MLPPVVVQRSVLVALVLGFACFACGQEGPAPTRVWTPADHGQPPERSVDPSRRARPTEARPERSVDPRSRAVLALWNVSCAACHGRTGAGDGPQRPAAVPNFADAAWQQSVTNEDIARVIAQGRGAMPAFGDRIQPQGIAALVELIRGFGAAPEARGDGAEPGPGAPAQGP